MSIHRVSRTILRIFAVNVTSTNVTGLCSFQAVTITSNRALERRSVSDVRNSILSASGSRVDSSTLLTNDLVTVGSARKREAVIARVKPQRTRIGDHAVLNDFGLSEW